jgi:hypothetical protein
MKAADDDEGSLGNWIAHNKKKELGTDSEREQLFKREVHLAFENKWNDNLESVKSFIAIEGRLESRKAADDEDIRFGNRVANNNKKNRSTTSP